MILGLIQSVEEFAIGMRYAAIIVCTYSLIQLFAIGATAFAQTKIVKGNNLSAQRYIINRRRINTAFTAVMSSALTLIATAMYNEFNAYGSSMPTRNTVLFLLTGAGFCIAARPLLKRIGRCITPITSFMYAVIMIASSDKADDLPADNDGTDTPADTESSCDN